MCGLLCRCTSCEAFDISGSMTPRLTQIYDNPLEDAPALAREIVAGRDRRTALAQQLSGLVEDVRLQLELEVG